MQRVEPFQSAESVIAYIMQGLTYYIDSRGSVKVLNGRVYSYSISWVSAWFRNSQLSLDRVLLAAATMLKLDSCDGDLVCSLAVINSAINSNSRLEVAYRDRPYSTSLERSLLHSLLIEAKEILTKFQRENVLCKDASTISSPS